MRISGDALRRRGADLEWLETDGLGGYSSSTLVNLATRRYHALLVTALDPPVRRTVLLSSLADAIEAGGRRFDLSSREHPGGILTEGLRGLTEFRLEPFPTFIHEAEGVRVEREICRPRSQRVVIITYRWSAPPGAVLEVRPLLAYRDDHSLSHENDLLRREVRVEASLLRVAPYEGLPPLYLAHDAEEIQPADFWYRHEIYARERERGLHFDEDLYSPFALRFSLDGRTDITLVASLSPISVDDGARWREEERSRRKTAAAGLHETGLEPAAEKFFVRRASGSSIIAGYPWFTDRGRDAMAALPGLSWHGGRPERARAVLRTFFECADRGLVPNYFYDAGGIDYASADASLWAIEAARGFAAATGDSEFVRVALFGTMREIMEAYAGGTRFGIRVESDGLLSASEPNVPLTWMDARVAGLPVTPRAGKPVELQALWVNALAAIEAFASEFGDAKTLRRASDLRELAEASFLPTFWNEDARCLFDVIGESGPDASIRPNQLLALSLPRPLVAGPKAEAVLESVEKNLATPRGLRTLAPADPRYRGRYDGTPDERNAAAHQGTVWPWLLLPYARAIAAVRGDAPEVRRTIQAFLEGFLADRERAALGMFPEMCDGEPPHAPRGCPFSALTTAALLEISREFALEEKPSV